MGVNVFASFGLDFSNFNFNQVYAGSYYANVHPNLFQTFHGVNYRDVVEVDWRDNGGTYNSSIFGGNGLTATSSGILTGGTVTGYLENFWNGSTWVPYWGIEGMSISASALQRPFLTASTADDYSMIQQIMAGNDTVAGSGFNDVLFGFAGNDILRGGSGKDVLDGGTGNDWAYYSDKTAAVAVTLAGAANASVKVGGVVEDTIRNIENVQGGSGSDTLTGDGQANSLFGLGGNDILRGGGGKDVLDGGTGKDWAYYSDKTAAVAVTLAGAANAIVKVNGVAEDTVRNIENLQGGSGRDTLTGDGLANSLFSLGGNDFLNGKAGNDVLTSGLGNDHFVFDTALNGLTNVDTITDFNVANDTIRLENSIFTKLTATGTLSAGAFHLGANAADASDRIIYNKATGDLFYDSNGNAAGGNVQFADLSPALSLTFQDFLIT